MSKGTNSGLGWGWLAMAGLACAAGLVVGRVAETPAESAASVDTAPLSEEVRYKIPVSMSQPKRGPDEALVTVVEWCDLSGADCRAADETIAALRVRYGERLRHVWRHLTEQPSEQSARAHEFASIAEEHAGKFWEARALLLKADHGPSMDDIKQYTAKLAMDFSSTQSALEKHTFAGAPAADGLFAAKFGVVHGPTFFVNGRRLLGPPSRERLARLIDIELTHAERVSRQGVTGARLYDEITKAGLWATAGSPLAQPR